MSAKLHPWSTEAATSSARYWCSACRRWHDGEPAGVVADLLAYCHVAIKHYESLNLIVKEDQSGAVPRFRLVRGSGIHSTPPSQTASDDAVLAILRQRFGDAVASVRTYRNPSVAYVSFSVDGIDCRASCSLTERDQHNPAAPEIIADLLATKLRQLLPGK